jgi:uncharacterized protein (DUF2147 family)
MGRGRIAALLAALLMCQGVSVARAEGSGVNGTWMIRDLVLNIFDCKGQVCGRIEWIRDPQRRPTQCGRTIVWGLVSEGPAQWTNGSILDPDDGKTYRLSASLRPDGVLDARIYKGVPLFGRTEVLRRVDLQSLSGRC